MDHNFNSLYYEALENRICLATLGLGLNEICIKRLNEVPKRIHNYSKILNQKYIREVFSTFNLKYLPIRTLLT